MHRFLPTTEADRAEMLETIGVKSVGELFSDIPREAMNCTLDLPPALSELELMRELREMSGRNSNLSDYACFLGAGAYNHFIPATVPHLVFRSEFYTAYTPYQAEISQGTLQTIFEYQSMICDLTGMDAANASHYDGATATAEAAILAINSYRDRDKIIVGPTLHPQYRATLRTYLAGHDIPIVGDEDLSLPLEEGPTSTSTRIPRESLCRTLIFSVRCAISVRLPTVFIRRGRFLLLARTRFRSDFTKLLVTMARM